jgi:virginiamycin B lyase
MTVKALLACAGLIASLPWLSAAPAWAQTAPTLSGQVSSAEEGAMEGVLVSAKKAGSTITTTVVSNDKGQFSFPAGRLEPGSYAIGIRAAGYDLSGPNSIEIADGAVTADIKLVKTRNPAMQLSSAEWLSSVPGDDKLKSFLPDCTNCHTLQRVFTSVHTPDEWEQVFNRMARYAPLSTPTHPQMIVPGGTRSERPRVPSAAMKQAAEFLARVGYNNPERPDYALQRLPRPTGRATHVVITEFDLPRKEALPHDVVIDPDGHAWYSDFGNQKVGELDPKTGKVSDYDLPTYREEQPKGSLDLELDPDGNLWLGMAYQGGAAKVDRKTKVVTPYPLKKEWLDSTSQTNAITPTNMHVDGKVWLKDSATRSTYKLDIATGQWQNVGEPTDPSGKHISGYGIPSDKDNNVWMLEFGNTHVGRLDAKSNVATIWATPSPRSRPRRGRFDEQNHLWFGEFGANAVGMFDPTTERIKEWKLPTPWSAPYDAAPSKNAEQVWTASMLTDQVSRIDPKTDEIVEYLLPRATNIRRVFVDSSGARPVLWVGNNHGAAIVRVEPLD